MGRSGDWRNSAGRECRHRLPALLLAYQLVLLAIAAALMIDYRYRTSRVATVSTLAVDLGQAEPHSLRDVLAATLGDPSLVLALATTEGEQFTDEAGRPLQVGHRSDRTLTELRDGDRRIAVLEHDPALLRDPPCWSRSHHWSGLPSPTHIYSKKSPGGSLRWSRRDVGY